MKKETRLVIDEKELYWTVDGKRLTPKQAELLQKRLDNEELDNILDEDSIEDSQKEKTNDSLWAIADDMRERKKRGEFDSYKEAYEWASKNLYKENCAINYKNLKRAFYKAFRDGRVEL
jgi:hypothetical protein